jgi:exopolyphosphatase/guanosine-5'-triphosphate,3'-diphosphate pyrophosphatase
MAHADPAGDLVLADIGGASTELIVATDGERRFSPLHPGRLGRMTDRHVRADPPTPAELAGVRADVAVVVESLDLPGVDAARLLVVGGTGEFLFRLAPDGLTSASPVQLEAMVARLTTISAQELTTLITIPEARARVLPAGATIALGLADAVEPRAISAGPSGIRTGLLLELARGVTA